uniref:G_PROTEIN_RECEP_F1_2 domain-containing protein n=1 Tax=Rhabditophanes sp. KR3021 TaxID=114890 RepID=A0AC35UFF6_9BILA
MEELLKPKYFAPVNKAYWAGAVEVLVLSFLSIFPNLYFLYKAITNDRFIKRPVLRKTVLILSVEFALASVHACANSLIYLIPYHFNLPMTVIGCSWVRTIFYITLLGVFSSPFIIYIDRHFKIIHSRGCNPFLLALIACIINLPSFGFVFANKLDSTPAYIFDEACSYQHFSINFYIQKIQYLMMFMLVASPILASLMNVYTFAKLQKQNKVVSQRRAKEQRQLFVTLSIQALYPCICYLPSISLGIYGTISKFKFN